MNNAKKLMKNQGVVAKKKNKVEVKRKKQKNILISGAVLAVLIIIGVCYMELKPKLILTVNDEKLYKSDIMYDIFTAEQQGNSMDSIYKQINGTGYWDMQIDESGTTGRESAKSSVIAAAKQREVLNQDAQKGGVALTAAENKTVAEKVASTIKGFTAAQKNISGLDESSLTKYFSKDALAAKYKKQIIDKFDIDDAKLVASVKKADYRQYDLQYYNVSTMKTVNKKSVAMTTAEKATLKKSMDDLLAKGKKAKDFTKLVRTNDKSGITYQTKALIETDKSFLTPALLKQVKAMKNGDISGVIETSDGIYFIKMVNNNSTEAYTTQTKKVVTDEEEKQFKEAYASMVEGYDISVNQAQWNQIEIGNITI